MEFSNWLLQESSLNDLYQSAVAAFPHTTKRQHATMPIKIVEFTWVPYLGMKTLFVKAIAQNEERVYTPIIVFKKVNYLESGGISLKDNNGKTYFLEQLSLQGNDCLVRCQCKDFKFRFNLYDHLDRSLYGSVNKHNSKGVANPKEMPGMCKHLMALTQSLHSIGIIV